MFQIIYPALRWVGRVLILLYVVLALAILGTRYVLLPRINDYKPLVQDQLSQMLDGQVSLGHIATSWYRLNPHIEITDFTLHGRQGQPVLTIPHVAAVLSWRSLFSLTPQFVSLNAANIDLSVRRDKQGHLWLLGHAVRADGSDRAGDADERGQVGDHAVRWLVAQPQIRLHDSTIRWVDEARSAEPLVLHDVTFNIRNQGSRHQFSLTARPADPLGGHFDMRGNFRRLDVDRPLALETGQGELYVHIDDMRPRTWEAWVDWPDFMQSDRVDVQAWMQVLHGQPTDITADVQVQNARWQGLDGYQAQSGYGRVHVSGPWPAFHDLMRERRASRPDQAVDFSIYLQDMQLYATQLYDDPLRVTTLGARGRLQTGDDGQSLQLQRLILENDDIALEGNGSWHALDRPGPGYLDARLQVSRASLDAVHRYMPGQIDADVTEWLEHGLLAGRVYDADVVIRGALDRFPFNRDGDDGEFLIRGPFRDAVIDYQPERAGSPGWPRLEAVNGIVELDRASLRVLADSAQMPAAEGHMIALTDIDARIDNMRAAPVLDVSGDTRADASAYMAFLHHSPLNAMLQHAFDKASAQGNWRLPLSLTIPLTSASDSAVRGTIQISDGQLQIDPDLPAFENLSGAIAFTQDDVVAEGLTGRFLGDAVVLSGGVGAGHDALVMQGRISADALRTVADMPGMARFSGATAYTARLAGIGKPDASARPVLTISSDLQGMAMDFPPPLDKAADETWPLRAVWAYRGNDAGRLLDVSLNESMHARFVRNDASGDTYFDSGSIAVGRDSQWDQPGLGVDVVHPVFDGDAWDRTVREFASPDAGGDGIFPRVRSLRVQTDQGRLLGLPLDHLTYTVQQRGPDEWRADISSTQTAGTLNWTEVDGTVQGPVQAVLHRLAYGEVAQDADAERAGESESAARDEEDRFEDDLQIPAINLIIENLRLYGRDVGKLVLVGVNEDRGDTWRLEQVTLSSPSAHLEGSGVWRLRGPKRGLSLDAEVDVSDLGDYFDQIGFDGVLSGGAGNVSMEIDWHALPWSFDVENIEGQVRFEFSKGRISTLHTRSARLLELLSLQSMHRLARMDVNPLTLTEDGFPYDLLRGQLNLERGRIYTEDYRVVGPAGTIVLDGLVYLTTGKLDLRAVVVPNLDVSGAAIAAGVAINPVVGLGAFLTQWLLKTPLAAAMTAQYKIDGSWEQPEINAVDRVRGQTDGAPD